MVLCFQEIYILLLSATTVQDEASVEIPKEKKNKHFLGLCS